MEYTEFVRPNGRQITKTVKLDDHYERLAQACLDHKDGCRFTFEDCRTFINLCFEANQDTALAGQEPDLEVVDVVCEIVSKHADESKDLMRVSWNMTIAKAADYLDIHIP